VSCCLERELRFSLPRFILAQKSRNTHDGPLGRYVMGKKRYWRIGNKIRGKARERTK
jgi:hypothetical protein